MGESFNLKRKINQRLIQPIIGFLKQGITPHKLALAISLGVCLGLFPVIGVTTLFCLGASLLFRLNLAAIQLVNYLIYPLQIILILPLMKLGSVIMNIDPIPYTIDELITMMESNFVGTLEIIWVATLLGIFAWATIILPFTILVYYLVKTALIRILKKQN